MTSFVYHKWCSKVHSLSESRDYNNTVPVITHYSADIIAVRDLTQRSPEHIHKSLCAYVPRVSVSVHSSADTYLFRRRNRADNSNNFYYYLPE